MKQSIALCLRRAMGCAVMSACLMGSAAFAQQAVVEKDQDTPEKVQRRERWFLLPRLVPGKSSADLLRQANEFKFKQRDLRIQMERVRRQKAASTVTTSVSANASSAGDGSSLWVPMGPRPIVHDPVDGQDYGSSTGRVSAIAVDQSDPTGGTVYVGGAYGGVWKSTNANAASKASITWTPLIDDQVTLSVGAIAVNGSTILVGTGEAKTAVDSYYGLGILRSTDGGATWNLIQTADSGATRIAGLGFAHIVFSADNPSLVVATTIGSGLSLGLGALTGNFIRGVFYSQDGGTSWHSVTVSEGGTTFQASSNGLIYDPQRHLFYAAMRFHGIYSSPDGATWTQTSAQPGPVTLADCPSTFSSSCPFWRGELAIRRDTGEMFAWFADLAATSQGVFKSIDGGASWLQLNTTSFDNCDDSSGSFSACASYQLFFNMTMAAMPNAADSAATDLYVGAGNIFKCTMNAANPTCGGSAEPFRFMDVTHVYMGACQGVAKVHPDQHAIAYSYAAPNVVYFGNDGGINRTLNSAALNTQSCAASLPFENLNDNIGSLTQFTWATPDPTDSTGLLAGAQDNGSSATGASIKSAHGLNGQQFIEVMSGDGGHTDIRRDTTPNYWYQSFTDATINLCTQGQGCGFNQFAASVYIDNTASSGDNLGGDESAFYAPFMVDVQVPSRLIVGTCRVWRGSSSAPFSGAAISPNFNTGAVTKCGSTDANGNSLSKIQTVAMGGPTTANGSQVVYAGMDDGSIWRTLTADNGAAAGNWVNVTPPVSLNWGASAAGFRFAISSVVVDATDATGKTAYAAVQGFGSYHVLKTTDGGLNWTGIGGPGLNGLPDAPANSLAIDPDDRTVIYVGTDVGVFVTANDGAGWNEVGPTEPGGSVSGYLPNSVVTHIAISEVGSTKQLVASTYGRGIWAATLPTNVVTAGSISLSPASLGFAAAISTVSAAKTLTVTNTGSSPVTLAAPVLGGANASAFEIAQTGTTCGSTLNAGASCAIAIVFHAPGATGAALTATLGVSANGVTPATAALSGLAEDFRISQVQVHGGSGTSATVTAGGSTQFDITIAPASGSFSGVVTLSCSGLPALTSCTFSPTSVTPGGTSASSTMTISTTSASGLRASISASLSMLALLWIGTQGNSSRKRRTALWLLVVLSLIAIMAMSGCGGGGGSAATNPGNASSGGTQKGSYTITVNASSGSIVRTSTVTLTVQ